MKRFLLCACVLALLSGCKKKQAEHTVGLHHWTIELPSDADVVEVRARVQHAGASVDEVDGGFRTYDPWRLAVDFVAA